MTLQHAPVTADRFIQSGGNQVGATPQGKVICLQDFHRRCHASLADQGPDMIRAVNPPARRRTGGIVDQASAPDRVDPLPRSFLQPQGFQ